MFLVVFGVVNLVKCLY